MKVLNTDINTADNLSLFEFTQGLDVDRFLYRQEIRVQKAWAQALQQANVLTSVETQSLIQTLEKAQALIESGGFEWKISDEDIHMNLERFLTEQLGELGKKIHTGRSRNDLIASTLRLYVHDEIQSLGPLLYHFILAIQEKSKQWIDVLTPGMTHMQFGQPLRFGHLFSSHGFAIKRDLNRLAQNKKECLEALPLGAAAFAGTHLQVDLMTLAKNLSFSHPLQHSYDAVSDRDYMLSTLQSYALLAMHLSRYCEDVLFWSSSGIKVLKLPYDWSTGSSIMPNKRNPDVPELVRAKMARVMTAAQEGLTLMRSVTPSYGSDIHELKRTFINATTELKKCLLVLQPFTLGLSIDEKSAAALLNKGHILATDVANHLAATSTFREAYVTVASAIQQADQHGLQIHEHYKNGHQYDHLTSIESRNLTGGTARSSALSAIEKLSL